MASRASGKTIAVQRRFIKAGEDQHRDRGDRPADGLSPLTNKSRLLVLVASRSIGRYRQLDRTWHLPSSRLLTFRASHSGQVERLDCLASERTEEQRASQEQAGAHRLKCTACAGDYFGPGWRPRASRCLSSRRTRSRQPPRMMWRQANASTIRNARCAMASAERAAADLRLRLRSYAAPRTERS